MSSLGLSTYDSIKKHSNKRYRIKRNLCDKRVNQDLDMADTDREPTPPVEELDWITDTFPKVKEFLEVTGFSFGGSNRSSEESPTRITLLSSLTNYHQST